jgi:hypothetical protein
MRTSQRFSPRVEGVESRALLSGGADVAPMIFPPPVLVRGHAHGSVVVFPSIPDVGTRYVLSGTGDVSPMRRVAVRGSIQTSSFAGQPGGTVTLANRFGGVELRITGRAGPEGSDAYQFEVASATGRFAYLKGTGGVLELTAPDEPRRGRFRMDINPFVIL